MRSYDRRDWMKFGINLLTATGAGISTVSIVVAFRGSVRDAWILLGVAMLIDWIDGSLVRYYRLGSALTEYDGRELDAFADYVSYVVGPVCVAWAAGVLPETTIGLITGLFVCGLSALQFAREDSKTDRAFFGWPSYWNFLYFYAWGLGLAQINSTWMIAISGVFALATLVPIPFPYPSMFPVQRLILIGLGSIWGIIAFGFLLFPSMPRVYLALSLLFPLYYLVLPLVYYDELVEDGENEG